MGSFSASPLWDCLPQLDARAVRSRTAHLSRMLGGIGIDTARAAKAMAVLAAFADEAAAVEANADDAEDAKASKLPPFEQWPVFLTRQGSCVTPKELRWPDDDYYKAPMAIQALLEPHILPSSQSQQQSSGFDGHGGKGGKGYRGQRQKHKHKQKPQARPEQGFLLDAHVQRMLRSPDGGSSLSLGVWKSAVECAKKAKAIDGTVIKLDDIVARFFESRVAHGSEAMKASVKDVVTITAWALQRRMAHRVTYVFAGDEDRLQLVSPAKVYIGAPYTETRLSELAGNNLLSISPCYALADSLSVSTPSTRQWREFFLSMGVNEGLRFEAKLEKLQSSDHRLLPERRSPQLRKSNKTVILPYGLGTMTSRQLLVIDCDLSAEWASLLQQLGKRKPPLVPPLPGAVGASAATAVAALSGSALAGSSFAGLLTRLHLDTATHPDGKSTPAVAAAIAGRESDPSAASMRLIPARRRLIYLPPGQAGAVLVDLGPAKWVLRLTAAAWVPCQGQGGLKPPKQVSLWTEREQGFRPGMPISALPDDIVRAFKSGNIAELLGFGTADPPKPMERLREMADAIKAQPTDDASAVCSDADLVDIWRELCTSEKQGKLTGAEKRDLRQLAIRLPLLPGSASNPDVRVKAGRCVTAPCISGCDTDGERAKKDGSTATTSADTVLVESMTGVGWLVDVSSPSWALVGVAETLISLLGIRKSVGASELGPFVKFVFETEPMLTDILRDGMTVATHRLLRQHTRPGSKHGQQLDTLESTLGMPMKCFCARGPQTLPSCWRLIRQEGTGVVRPLINDDAEKASMLTKEHGFQFAGMFNHERSVATVADTLALMDADIVSALQIPRLSSPDFAVRIQTRGAGEDMADAKTRFVYVLDLLKKWCLSNGLPDPGQLSATKMNRFRQIVKTFTVPGAAPIKSSVWACWRR
jgi:hypothetical protein